MGSISCQRGSAGNPADNPTSNLQLGWASWAVPIGQMGPGLGHAPSQECACRCRTELRSHVKGTPSLSSSPLPFCPGSCPSPACQPPSMVKCARPMLPTLPNNPASSRRPGGTVCVAKRARWPTAFSTLALKHGMPGEKVPRVRVVLGSWGLHVSGVAGWSDLSWSPQPPYQAAPIIIPTLQTNRLILRAQGPADMMMHQSQVLNPVPTIPTPTWHCLHRC